MTKKIAILLTLITALIWSTAGINVKLIDWSPFAIAGGRSIIATVLLIPFIIKSKKFKIDKYVLGGAISYTCFNYCYITSTKLTTTAMAIMMQYTAPVYIALLCYIFLKEKIKKSDLISMIFVALGMVLFFADSQGGGSLVGNIIAIFNGVSFAGVGFFLHLQKEDGNPVMTMFLGNIITGIIGIPFIVQAKSMTQESFIYFVIFGMFFTLAYTLYAIASTQLSALEIVLIPIVDPILNPVWVFIVLGEAPGVVSILGAIIVLTAVTTNVIYGLKKPSYNVNELE